MRARGPRKARSDTAIRSPSTRPLTRTGPLIETTSPAACPPILTGPSTTTTSPAVWPGATTAPPVMTTWSVAADALAAPNKRASRADSNADITARTPGGADIATSSDADQRERPTRHRRWQGDDFGCFQGLPGRLRRAKPRRWPETGRFERETAASRSAHLLVEGERSRPPDSELGEATAVGSSVADARATPRPPQPPARPQPKRRDGQREAVA